MLRSTGPRPYESSLITVPVCPSRAAFTVSGPPSGIADRRPGGPLARVLDDRDGSTAQPGDAEHGEVVPRLVVQDRSVELASRRGGDGRVVLAGDDVRVGHHELGRRDPARPLDAEPAGGAANPHHRRRGTLTSDPAIAPSGIHVRLGPRTSGWG